MSGELVKRETNSVMELYSGIESKWGVIQEIGGALALSGMFGCTKKEQGMVLMLAAMAENASILDIKRKYHIINGELSMRTDYMLASFLDAGGTVKWANIGDDGVEARATFAIDGQTIEMCYSMDDARRAGLVKPGSGWTKTPGAMMRARLVSKALRILRPQIVAGVYTPEEVADFKPDVVEKPLPAAPSVPKKVEVVGVEAVAEVVDPEGDPATSEAATTVPAEVEENVVEKKPRKKRESKGATGEHTHAQLTAAVTAAFAAHQHALRQFFLTRGYITDEQTIDDATDETLKRCLEKQGELTEFLKVMEGGEA